MLIVWAIMKYPYMFLEHLGPGPQVGWGSVGVSAENHPPSRVLSELRTLEVSRESEISRVGAGLDREAGSEAGQAPAGTYLPRCSRNMISCETQRPPGDGEKNRPPHPRHQKHRGPREESVGTRGRVWRVCKFQFNFVDILNLETQNGKAQGFALRASLSRDVFPPALVTLSPGHAPASLSAFLLVCVSFGGSRWRCVVFLPVLSSVFPRSHFPSFICTFRWPLGEEQQGALRPREGQ